MTPTTPAPDLGPLPEPVRDAFERWAKDFGRIFLDRLASGYKNQWTQECWVAWQGAWTVAHAAGVAAGVPATVARQALEALENCSSEHGHRCSRCDSEVDEGGKVIDALRAALASPTTPTPDLGPLPETDVRWVDGKDQWGYDDYSSAHSDEQLEAERARTYAQGYAAGVAAERTRWA